MTDQRCSIALIFAVLATIALYYPGLNGSFLFDDFPNIVDNAALHVTQSTPAAWLGAAWASPSSDLQRPLASLSFALNHYFSGLDPRAMKATNLAIHLLNGILLFALLRAILRPRGARFAMASPAQSAWLPILVTTTWLLHPINLTAVLFVVQRMESLAQIFVLAGLLLYLDARVRRNDGRPGAWLRLWIGVPLCTVLGVMSKESAALLPAFALMLEFTVLRDLRRGREVATFYIMFLLVPGILGMLWLVPGALSEGAYEHRAFTLGQRLLTEPRVLVDYGIWTLFPAPDFFSFYRDDYPISTSLAQPWTTIPAMAALSAAVFGTYRLQVRRPLTALGLGWFLTAHALTATVFPLELVFEHRNYFASIGLLLAAFDLLLPRKSTAKLVPVRIALIGAIVALASGSLALRARIWGDPVKFAVSEAARHPNSPRATYDLGRTYVVLSGYRKDSANLPRAISALEAAARVPRASILPEVGLIMTASHVGLPIDGLWWDSIMRKVGRRAPTPEDAAALRSLTLCQREGHCQLDDQRMLQVYLTASSHEHTNPAVLYSYAIFAQNRLGETSLALQLSRDAARSRDLQYQLNLVNFLIDLGRHNEALIELAVLKRRARPGSMIDSIGAAERRLAADTGQPR